MIHVFVGTKAQFIKMAPVIRRLDEEGVEYNFIDSGQHAAINRRLVAFFGLRRPDVCLRGEADDNISSFSRAVAWFCKWLLLAVCRPGKVRERVFRGRGGVCLIHGDTASTLLGLLLARRAGLKVAHVEAGLRSYSLWHPFPEELIRLLAVRGADVLFAPCAWAHANLRRMGVAGAKRVINIGENTLLDALEYARRRMKSEPPPGDNDRYVLVTIHRLETICRPERLREVVQVVEETAARHEVLFLLHEPTRRRLERFSLLERLENCPRIRLEPLQDYPRFLALLQGCEFVITDGGSVQEESFYLNIPCLLLRKRTERRLGLGENVCLSGFEKKIINDFQENYAGFKRKTIVEQAPSPSRLLVAEICSLAGEYPDNQVA